MEERTAIEALGALAQETRLRGFRLLVQSGETGMAAGELARALEVPANTLSTHLALLAKAGLVLGRREGRSVIYAANYEGMRRLLGYLMEDCCRGRPEACAALLDAVLPGACCAPE